MRKLGAQLCGTSQVAIHYSASKHKLQQIVFVVSIHRLVRLHECAKLINGATVGVCVETRVTGTILQHLSDST